jgi:hypothetical protein
MLITTLNSEQLVLGQSPSADEIRRRYGRAIAIAARSLERNLELSPGQRDRVTRLVLSKTRAPDKLGAGSELTLLLYQMSRLPEDSIRPIFDDDQWQSLRGFMAAYEAGSLGGELLARNGYVFEQEPIATRPAPAPNAGAQAEPPANHRNAVARAPADHP